MKAVASGGVSLLPAPPAADAGAAESAPSSGLVTDADKLRERYRRIGEAQNHVFGEGLPGSKPPDFNLNPDAVKRVATPAAPGAAAPPGARQGDKETRGQSDGARERASEGATGRPATQPMTGAAKPQATQARPFTGPVKPATVNPAPPKTSGPVRPSGQTVPVAPRPKPAPSVPPDPSRQ